MRIILLCIRVVIKLHRSTLKHYMFLHFCTTTFECCRKLSRGLQSGFLKHYVIVSMTISYRGQGGQKCRGWLSCRYIFLRLA